MFSFLLIVHLRGKSAALVDRFFCWFDSSAFGMNKKCAVLGTSSMNLFKQLSAIVFAFQVQIFISFMPWNVVEENPFCRGYVTILRYRMASQFLRQTRAIKWRHTFYDKLEIWNDVTLNANDHRLHLNFRVNWFFFFLFFFWFFFGRGGGGSRQLYSALFFLFFFFLIFNNFFLRILCWNG